MNPEPFALEAAQTAEKMAGLIEEHGWCVGTLCVTKNGAEAWRRRFTDLEIKELSPQDKTRINEGAICIQGAGIIALDLATHDQLVNAYGAGVDAETKLLTNPVWLKLSDGKGWSWNDSQGSAEPVLGFLRDRAAVLYEEAGQ